MTSTYAIQFNYPEGTLYAGMYKGAAGWAPTLATAELFTDPDAARRMLGAYGPENATWGRVVQVATAPQ